MTGTPSFSIQFMNSRKEQLAAFERMLDILDELRVKCPWDRKQTNESLRPNTIEEVFELADALMADDRDKLEEMFRLSTQRRAAFDKKDS